MKTITTLTAVAVLIAGMSIAAAQNAAGPAPSGGSPSSLNRGSNGSKAGMSGSESKGTAMEPAKSTTGAGMQSPSKDVTNSPASPDAGTKDTKDTKDK
jgi:hypothetical protein